MLLTRDLGEAGWRDFSVSGGTAWCSPHPLPIPGSQAAQAPWGVKGGRLRVRVREERKLLGLGGAAVLWGVERL